MVAWRITGNGAVPVSPGEDVPWFSDAVGVQLPDGRIDASVSAPHDDEKSWLRTVAFLAKAKGKAVRDVHGERGVQCEVSEVSVQPPYFRARDRPHHPSCGSCLLQQHVDIVWLLPNWRGPPKRSP